MGFPYINIPNATPMALNNNKSPRTGYIFPIILSIGKTVAIYNMQI
jgi:hypothetical protein